MKKQSKVNFYCILIGFALFLLCFSLVLIISPTVYAEDVLKVFSEHYEDYTLNYYFLEDDTICITNSIVTTDTIIIPDSIGGHKVTRIGEAAFRNNNKLKSVSIPDTVTGIDSQAFSFSGLETITISANIVDIPANPFNGCNALVSVNIVPDNTKYVFVDGVLFDRVNMTIISYTNMAPKAHFDVPQGIMHLADYAFSYCNLESITIANSVRTIGQGTFQGCASLSSIVIPDSVSSIGPSAFSYCSALTACVLPYGIDSIAEETFSQCEQLNAILIPDSVTNIGDCAFFCSGLTSITMPQSLLHIGSQAFYNCKGLASITIPGSVTCVGTNPFEFCYNLSEIIVETGNTSLEVLDDVLFDTTQKRLVCYSVTKTTEDYEIPQGTVMIDELAFANCNFTSITIPSSVTKIDGNPFSTCQKLRSIYVHPENSVFATIDGILFNKNEKELVCCPKKKEIDAYFIPQGIRYIGMDAFASCGITSVEFPASVMSIEDNAFRNCSLLSAIQFSEGLISIGESAFQDCTALTSVVIPDSVQHIHQYAFSGCNLSNINLPNALTCIDRGVFMGCMKLTSVAIPENIKSIGENAFNSCKSLTDVTIGNGVTDIGNYAFGSCSNLLSVTIGNSVVNIGTSAFNGCKSLVSINIPNSVISIGNYAFRRCNNLHSIVLPLTVTNIGTDVFGGCDNLLLTVSRNSYSRDYALKNNIHYQYTDNMDWIFDNEDLDTIDR